MSGSAGRRLARQALGAFVVCVGLLLGVTVLGAPATSAQEAPNEPQVEVPHIIPRPNSGAEPKAATDRGGWVQEAIFFSICGAILFIALLVFLESRRKLRARAEAEAKAAEVAQQRSSTRSEPVAETSAKAPDSNARQ